MARRITLLLSVLFFIHGLLAQENGGPYTPDENTVLLLHLDGDITNSAAYGGNGIIHGTGVSYTSEGVHGSCLRLDNSSADKQSWIEVPFYDELNSAEAFSVECWFKINSWGENQSGVRSLFKKEADNGAMQFEAILFPETGSGQVNVDCIDDDDGEWGADAGIIDILELDTWYHLAMYYKHDYKHVYCLIRDENYKEVYATSGYSETSAVTGDGKFMIGYGGWNESVLDCYIDELRISNTYRKYRDDVLEGVDINAFEDSVFLPLKDKWAVYQWPLGEYYPINNETGEIFRENSCGPTMLTRTIHYWEYPRFPRGEIQHDMENCDWYADYNNTEYLWDLMPEVFLPGTTEDIYAPSATLSAQVGTASRKFFDSMYAMPEFLKKNFLFSEKTRVLFEDEYTQEEFENIIKNELNHGRPVMVGGVAERSAYGGSGHYYIINGYNSKNEFYTDFSFNDIYWEDLSDFYYGISQDIIIYMEPDWNGKALTLDYPAGGEYIHKQSELEITWSSSNVDNLLIEYSIDGGKNYNTIANDVDASTGMYSWICPETISDLYKIRISDTGDGNIYRKSGTFDIIDHVAFAFAYPGQNTHFQKGTDQPVYWQSTGIDAFKLEISTDNQTWQILYDSIPARSGSVLAPIPPIETSAAILRVSDLNEGTNMYYSEPFQIISGQPFCGPYSSDSETVLLMHFEDDLSNSSNKQFLPVETTPIGYYEPNYSNNLGKAFRNINGDIVGNAILVKNSENIDLGNDWTMESWVRISSINGERTVAPLIINKWDAFNISAAWNHFSSVVNFENGTEVQFNNPDEYELDKWYHVALISDANTEKVYFYIHDENKNQIHQEEKVFPDGSNGTIRANEHLLTIGGLGGGSNLELDGYLDEVRIVKRSELSAYAEVLELPFFDDFGNNLDSWTIVSLAGDDRWHISGDDGIDGGKCARFYATSDPKQTNDDWLISPVFNTDQLADISITFKYKYDIDGISPDFYYSHAFDGNPENSDWTQIDNGFWTNAWDWQDAQIKISNPGASFVFAVRYQVSESAAYYYLMDNIQIRADEITRPTVATSEATNISSGTALLHGQVSLDGGSSISQRGFYWSSTSSSPDASDNVEIVSGTTGAYSFELTDLLPETSYYFRAFATNNKGTAVGEVRSLTTGEKEITVLSLPFSDNFEESISNDAVFLQWSTENITGWNYWHIITGGGIDDGQCMRFEKTGIDQEDWLITLPVNSAEVNKLKISFNELHSGDGPQPALLYTTTYNGNKDNSVWTEIDYSLGQAENQWNSINDLVIDNPGDLVYLAFKYESTPSDELYLLLDNFSIEAFLTNILNIVSPENGFMMYPNPVTVDSRIFFEIDREQGVDISFYDLNGRKVNTLVQKVFPKGRHSIAVNINLMSEGMYLCKLSLKDSSSVIKLLIE